MRLLRCEPNDSDGTIHISLEEPSGIPAHAILSHKWREEEVSFADINNRSAEDKKGYSKLAKCCQQASDDGYLYVWIDTCCIDKSSSTELSEAINSMYAWYRDAKVCYAYLDDVESDEDPTSKDSSFRRSEWFRRGWTLQELIAPRNVVFLARDWIEIGSKVSLAEVVEEITKVDQAALGRTVGFQASVAERMSWAAIRETTRPEDKAYSLMGLFGINMPILYGEGSRAFVRLQEEILKVSSDHSIFAWDSVSMDEMRGPLARSPLDFTGSHDIEFIAYKKFKSTFDISAKTSKGKLNARPDYAMTNFGVSIQLPLQKVDEYVYCAYLACNRGRGSGWMRIWLEPQTDKPPGHYARVVGRSPECGMDVDLQNITIEDIYIDDVDGSNVGSPLGRSIYKFGRPVSRSIYKFDVTMIDISKTCRFKLVGCYPSNYYSLREQEPMRLMSLDKDYEVLSFKDLGTQKSFSAILGVDNERTWSDVAIVEQNKRAEMIFRDYGEPADLGQTRCKHLDWVKKPLVGNTGSVLMTVREVARVEPGDVFLSVRITVQ